MTPRTLIKASVCFTVAATLYAASADSPANRLTPQEKKDGYILMFNGKDLDG